MNKIERLQNYVTKVKTQEAEVMEQIVQKYEYSLPEELKGLFTYDHYWFNGRSFHCRLTFENINAQLRWDNLSSLYEVVLPDPHNRYTTVNSHEELAKQLIRRLEK